MKRVVVTMLIALVFTATVAVGQFAAAKTPQAKTTFRSTTTTSRQVYRSSTTYDVKSYGAVGNGVTNDTNAIQAAMDALPSTGCTLYFPAGTYIVKASAAGTFSILRLEKTHVKVTGDGAGVSIIKVANSCPTYSYIVTGLVDLTGLEVCNLTFDHNIANNPIASASEIMNWPEVSIRVYTGNEVYIHNTEVKNASSVNNIEVDGNVSNVTIQNNTCSNCGDDPNHILHDASFIYVHGSGYVVSGNVLKLAKTNLPGAETAIETHGANYTVENNSITNWKNGMNITGIASTTTRNVNVTSNNISGCFTGINLWSNSYDNHTTGFGIDGMNVTNNSISLEQVDPADGYEQRGISIEKGSNLDIRGLHISGNTIVSSLDSSGRWTNSRSHAIGWISDTGRKLYDSSITDNVIRNVPLTAVCLKCNMQNVSITGNTLTDAGSTLYASIVPDSKTPVSIVGAINGLRISGNAFLDDLPVTRTRYFIFARATSSTGFAIENNSFRVTGNWASFVRQIELDDDTACPLITGTINGFVPPDHKVQHNSLVKDGGDVWTVGSEGLYWTKVKVLSSFYFAEGYTGPNFAEYLCLGNPGGKAAKAIVTYMFSDGTAQDASYEVPAGSRYTVDVNGAVGPGREVSIRVLSDSANLVAERPMYFNYNGSWEGGSDAMGATAPARDWYFAEGNTLPNFEEYVTVLNPSSAAASLTFHYMVEGKGKQDVGARVGPNSRATFKTRDQIGSGKNASLYLQSDQDVVAERPMYFDYHGIAANNWTGGHDVVGANSPARDWYFAEGTTRNDFEQWLTLQNPGTARITVNATFMLGAGQGRPVKKSYSVAAGQRLTVLVNAELGPGKDNSVHLTSTSDFIAERPLYFNYQGAWDGGHVVLGANSPGTTWVFAEGCTAANFNEWLCLQNPGSDTAHVSVTYYLSSGAPIIKPWTVAPGSRLTIDVNADAGPGREVCTRVTSDKPVIAERPMYFNYNGCTGGHDVVGFWGHN